MSKLKKGQAEFVHWMGPLLDCLRALGGSAKPKEVSSWIARELQLPPEITEATIKSGANRFHNQVQWARQYLVWDGLLDDSKRGLWVLSPLGWKAHLDEDAARTIFLGRVKISQSLRKQDAAGDALPIPETTDAVTPEESQELDLLDILKSLPPYGFELICGRLLREHGFEDVEVTQRSRDGGIDGYGLLRLSPFVSLRVAFQAKRYKDVVSRSAVGEFRNALLGRAEKGVFITTGRFTNDAESEASRDGVVPIELIDGEQLVELFQDAGIGVKPKTIYEIDHAFFDEFRREQ
ncbi:mrr restriction system protein [Rhodanobacter panaciterrae]|uniref:Mrr restriction system protein n=1 Tax=Rhodanobacter panaciterrae TaxID=490572 RepID=A0ABQ3A361_9GAMM|nr:restriction endonuclease [Rhodanobacter panaciterrae]GGY32796.1 mrr restriction system protein [Rhodanobacter panaciterrae]